MINLDNIIIMNEITYMFMGYGVAKKITMTLEHNNIKDYQIMPVDKALKESLIPDYIKIPETVELSPGSPVETPLDRWVLISYIKPESLEPYLKDIYMEDLYKTVNSKWAQKI